MSNGVFTERGYELVMSPLHPRANHSGYVKKHVLVAEKALGKYLAGSAEVHHINGNNGDNRNVNLIICEGRSYHMLLHHRRRAFDACGHAHWKKCLYCKEYDDPINLRGRPTKNKYYHRDCYNENQRLEHARRKRK
jgi:uncharacterized protein (DUF1330 family)